MKKNRAKLPLRHWANLRRLHHEGLLQYARNEKEAQRAKENIEYYKNLANTHT